LQAPESYIQRYSDIPQKNRRVYAAMVTCMDDAVGRIIASLDEAEFPEEKTLIFFCSDNGGIPRFGSNRELRSGKGQLYEGGVRVPAVAVWNGVLPAGRQVDQPLHIVDMYPTLIGLAGGSLQQDKPLDGKNAWPTISAGAPSPHRDDFVLHNLTPFNAAIRIGDWKLIRNGDVGANATSAPDEDSWELYNIREDVSEKTDLKVQRPAIVQRLAAKLARLEREAAKPNIPPNRAPRGFQVPKIWGHADATAK
jgi:arylsulfatase A-like enzyme